MSEQQQQQQRSPPSTVLVPPREQQPQQQQQPQTPQHHQNQQRHSHPPRAPSTAAAAAANNNSNNPTAQQHPSASSSRGNSVPRRAGSQTPRSGAIVMDEAEIQVLLKRNKQLEYEAEKLNESLLHVCQDNNRLTKLVTLHKEKLEELMAAPLGNTLLRVLFDKDEASSWFTSKTQKDAVAAREAMEVLLEQLKDEYAAYRAEHTATREQVSILTESLVKAHAVIEQHARLFSAAQKQRKEIVLTYSDFNVADEYGDNDDQQQQQQTQQNGTPQQQQQANAAQAAADSPTRSLEVIAAREEIAALKNQLVESKAKQQQLAQQLQQAQAEMSKKPTSSSASSPKRTEADLLDEIDLLKGEADALAQELASRGKDVARLQQENQQLLKQQQQQQTAAAAATTSAAAAATPSSKSQQPTPRAAATATTPRQQQQLPPLTADEKERKIFELQTQLTSMEETLTTTQSILKEDIVALSKEKKTQAKRIEQLEQELQIALDASKFAETQYQQQLQQQQSSGDQAALAHMKSRLENSAAEVEAIRQMLDEADNRVEELKQQLATKEKELAAAKSELEQQREQVNKVQAERSTQRKRAETAEEQAAAATSAAINTVPQEDFDKLRNEHQLAEKRIVDLTTHRDTLATQLQEQRSENQRLVSEINTRDVAAATAANKLLEATREQQRLSDQVKQHRDEVHELTAELKSRDEKIARLQQSHESGATELDRELQEARTARDSLKEKQKQLKEQVDTLTRELKSRDEQIATQQKELAEMKQQRDLLTAKAAQSASQVDLLSKELKQRDADAAALKKQHDEQHKAVAAEAATIKAKLDEAIAENSVLNEMLLESEKKMEAALAVSATSNSKSNNMGGVIEDLEGQLKSLRQAVADANTQVLHFKAREEQLSEELTSARAAATRLERENEKLVEMAKHVVAKEEKEQASKHVDPATPAAAATHSRSNSAQAQQLLNSSSQQQQDAILAGAAPIPHPEVSEDGDIESARRQLIMQHQLLNRQRQMLRDLKKKLATAEEKLEKTENNDQEHVKALQSENHNVRQLVTKLEKRVQVAEVRYDDAVQKIAEMDKLLEREKQQVSRAFKEAEIQRKDKEKFEQQVKQLSKQLATSNSAITAMTPEQQQQQQEEQEATAAAAASVPATAPVPAEAHNATLKQLASLLSKYNSLLRQNKLLKEQLSGWRALNESIAVAASAAPSTVVAGTIRKNNTNSKDTSSSDSTSSGAKDKAAASNSKNSNDKSVDDDIVLDPSQPAPITLEQYRAMVSQLNMISHDREVLSNKLMQLAEAQAEFVPGTQTASSGGISPREIQQFRTQHENKVKALQQEVEVQMRVAERATAERNAAVERLDKIQHSLQFSGANGGDVVSLTQRIADLEAQLAAAGEKKKRAASGKKGGMSKRLRSGSSVRSSGGGADDTPDRAASTLNPDQIANDLKLADDDDNSHNQQQSQQQQQASSRAPLPPLGPPPTAAAAQQQAPASSSSSLEAAVLTAVERLSHIAEALISPLPNPQLPQPSSRSDNNAGDEMLDTITIVESLARQCVARAHELLAALGEERATNKDLADKIAAATTTSAAAATNTTTKAAAATPTTVAPTTSGSKNNSSNITPAELEYLRENLQALEEKTKADQQAMAVLSRDLKMAKDELQYTLDDNDKMRTENHSLIKELELTRKKLAVKRPGGGGGGSLAATAAASSTPGPGDGSGVFSPTDADFASPNNNDGTPGGGDAAIREINRLKKHVADLQEEIEVRDREALETLKLTKAEAGKGGDALRKATARVKQLEDEFAQVQREVVPLKQRLAETESFLARIGVTTGGGGGGALPTKLESKSVLRLEQMNKPGAAAAAATSNVPRTAGLARSVKK